MAGHPSYFFRLLPRVMVACLPLWLAACGSSELIHGKYTYREQGRKDVLIVDERALTISDGHLVEGYSSCPGEFVCLKSPWFVLIVPRALDDQEQWSKDGHAFRVVGKHEVTVGSRPIELYKIESVVKGIRYHFDFSPDLGLLAFRASSPEGTGYYRIEGSCGYGASRCGAPVVKV